MCAMLLYVENYYWTKCCKFFL